jgi:hypothetical protein
MGEQRWRNFSPSMARSGARLARFRCRWRERSKEMCLRGWWRSGRRVRCPLATEDGRGSASGARWRPKMVGAAAPN